MKKILIAAICCISMGCATHSKDNDRLFLLTEMTSPVSGKTSISVTADSLLKQENTKHLIRYALRPIPNKPFQDELDKKFAAATMFIELDSSKKTAYISGNINYYNFERYENATLVGDSIKEIIIPEEKVQLSLNKTETIILPRGIKFTLKLSNNHLFDS